MNNKYINAVMYVYGFTKKEAINYIKTANKSTLELLYNEFTSNARTAFYND